jgi:hypothetical protein
MSERQIGEAWIVDDSVVKYIVRAESEDGQTIGDTQDIVSIDDFLAMGFHLDGELKAIGDRVRILLGAAPA